MDDTTLFRVSARASSVAFRRWRDDALDRGGAADQPVVRFAYFPIVVQLIAAKKMTEVDSARFAALASIAMSDAIFAVFDAKFVRGSVR